MTMDAAPFLERDEELAALWQTLRSVERERRGRVAVVAGEAGVGKSELLRRFREQAERSARFLWAACEPLHTPRPLGPLLDIAEVVGGELEAKVAAGAAPHDVAVTILREHWAWQAQCDLSHTARCAPPLVWIGWTRWALRIGINLGTPNKRESLSWKHLRQAAAEQG